MGAKPRAGRTAKPGLAQLKACEFFHELSNAELGRVLAIGLPLGTEKGQVIFHEGDRCTALYLLVRGEVKMYKVSPEGKEQGIRRIQAGQVFGGAPVFQKDGVYPATASSLVPSELLAVPKNGLIEMLKENPALSLKMLSSISGHLQEMMKLVETVSLATVPQRLARHLLELAKQQGGPRAGQRLRLGQSQAALAAQLGTVREVVWRSLHTLEENGVLEVQGREIVLRSPDGLADV